MYFQKTEIWQWVVAVFSIIFLIILGFILFKNPPTEKTCEYYRDWSSQSVPARCIKYFQN